MYNSEDVLQRYDRAIHKIAHKYFTHNPRFTYDDLVAQGQWAAIKASKSYDKEKGDASFFTYLTNTVNNEVRKYVGDNIFEVTVTEHEQRKEFKKSGNIDNIHEKAGVGAVRIEDGRGSQSTPAHGSYIGANDTNHGLGTLVNSYEIIASGQPTPQEEMIKNESISIMMEELKDLPDREKNILELRWFEGKTLQEIADNYNVSKQTIHGWEKKGFEKLRRTVKMRLS